MESYTAMCTQERTCRAASTSGINISPSFAEHLNNAGSSSSHRGVYSSLHSSSSSSSDLVIIITAAAVNIVSSSSSSSTGQWSTALVV
jgi:hypothetical protein